MNLVQHVQLPALAEHYTIAIPRHPT
jgi:hypothetical protein